ncbi:HPr kinase/phosphorylase [Sphingorhabdus sp.]|jgi:HPr kinase/phosphorylase|uniref:HPr kinase/phosphorylase n=1 Tax=Sphingorhabdus sp. TaxID=1902408 RepID=UPI003783912A
MPQMIHGTAISIGGHAVMIMGESGSGKSDLALRLIDRGAILISDDVVFLKTRDNTPILTVAPNIAGKIEVRGVGIFDVDFIASAPLRLVIEFVDAPDRLPEDIARTNIGDYVVPVSRLNPFEQSSAIKVEYALRAVLDRGALPEFTSAVSAKESLPS